MRSYVINLDRAQDRLAHMQVEFAKCGADFVRIPALDARELSPDDLRRYQATYPRLINPSRRWPVAYMACFLGHLRAWNAIADGPDECAAVFEDDVHLSSNFAAIARSDYDIPGGIDLVRLETTCQGMRLSRRPIAQWGTMKMFALRGGAWGAAGYLIRRDVARWLRASPPRFHYSVDWMLFQKSFAVARALSVAQLDPAPCVQDQYLPNKAQRHNFTKETRDARGFARTTSDLLRVLSVPPTRALLRKRAVPFG